MSSTPEEGGSTALMACRIVERCTSRRASPPLASAKAPSTQTIPIPTHAVRTEPRNPSTAVAAGDVTRPRNRAPIPSKPTANTMPAINAPTRANAGDHGDRLPSSRTSGPIRVPMNAPAAKPNKRERAGDESLRPAEQAQQHDDAHDQPVDAGHLLRAY